MLILFLSALYDPSLWPKPTRGPKSFNRVLNNRTLKIPRLLTKIAQICPPETSQGKAPFHREAQLHWGEVWKR